jgi:hypothetical protein
MSALGHVWTAPWQELSDVAPTLVGCGHVRSVCAAVKPLAIMLCADRVPIVSTHFKVRRPKRVLPIPGSTLSALRRSVLANSLKTSNAISLPGLISLNRTDFDATSLYHFDAAELAPSTASKADIRTAIGHVGFTPEANIQQLANIEHRKGIRSPCGRHRIVSPGMSVERRIRPVPCSPYRT